ncbi:cadherin repeat domain-containing protein, partial [Opitutales bacterium]|nr:cadherin repeat domain-containing protein [Opitutales bacterium]
LGTHILNIRYKDDNGTWGEILKQPFTIFNPAPDLNQSGTTGNYSIHGISNIAAAEYFIDADPGEGNATFLTPADGNFSHSLESIVDTQIPVSTLSLGIHQIGIRYQDSNGTWGEVLKSNFKVEAFTGNYSPTNLVLDNNSILENRPVGSTIGTFTAIDPDANNTLTYSFIDNNNTSPQNNLFALESNGTLKTASSFDYESNNTYSIRVQVKDDHNATTEGNFSILITNIIEDFDGDGTEDAYDSDDDNDGFSDHSEIAYGSNPRDANSTANSPSDLNTTSPLQVSENQPVGTIVGQLTATDPDANTTLTFTLVAGANDNQNFTIETNGTLRTAIVFDFESNSSFTIQAKVRDQHNLWIKENFTVQITNIIEDFDGDGTEDAYDSDDDNDGFSDHSEIAYGSNPRDANSTANSAPTELNATAPLQVSENHPVGTIVGQLTATDPDANATLNFTLVAGANDNQNFTIETNGTLRTATVFDFESNSSFTIQAKVRDQHNLWITKNFTVQITNIIEDFDGDGIEDAYDPDDDNDGFSDTAELAYGSNPLDANSTANAAPTQLIADSNLTIMENSPIGSTIGTFSAQDIDSKTTLTYSLIEGNSSTHNQAFSLDPNGTLSSAILFDYESNRTTYSITVRVSDQFNASIQHSFPVYVLNDPSDDPQPPIESNQTTEPVIDQNQTDHNQTTPPIIDQNQTDSNSTTAPIVDQNATPTSENNQTIVIQPNPVTPVKPDTNQTKTYWWTPLPETVEGWRTSDWFGSFRPFPSSWLYHTELGWMHATHGESGDLWLWNQEFGWLWTANGVFPHFFNHASANWIYFLKKQDGKARYYDYSTESVK